MPEPSPAFLLGQNAFDGRKRGRLKSFLLSALSFFEFGLGSVRCWWGICLCCAGILAWSTRHSMNPDGLSYLDLASNASSGGPSTLVNGVWSPGYPALLSIALFLFRPSSSQEFPLIHFVNFVIFIFTLWAFSVFFRYWFAAPYGDEVVNEDKNNYLTPFAFSTFLWCTLTFIGTELVTPDLGVAAIVFLAAGISCRLSLPGSSWRHYVALGFVLGVGYYFKAPLLPLGVTLLVLLFFMLPPSTCITRQKLLLSLCLSFSVLLVVVTPLVAALSVHANRLSFGEAGRLNYAWHVNGLQWTNGTNATGMQEEYKPNTTPEHPAPKLLTTPLTLEFASPIKGTYPLWYDPSYWYAGAKVRFDVRQQIVALEASLRDSRGILFYLPTMPFLSGAMVLFLLSLRETLSPAAPRVSWWQLAWPLAACSMYALVHFEPRYVGPFLVLFWLAIYRILMFRVNRRVTVAVLATVLFTLMVPFMFNLAKASASVATDIVHPRPPEYQIAALGLRDLGLQNGDSLAIVGYAYDCYYARYDRLRVVAQIPDAHQFWRLSTPELKSLTERLTAIGVKAVVASNRPDVSAPADWKDVKVSDSLRLSVLLLSPEAIKTR